MTLALSRGHVQAIRDHAQEAYPEEGCGLLIGSAGDPKQVSEVRRAVNIAETNRSRRYVIDPHAILAADRDVRHSGREVLGFYHSHPDHPARPSAFDEARGTWPGYSYLIVSVVGGEPTDLRAWVLDSEGGPFRAETLSITPD